MGGCCDKNATKENDHGYCNIGEINIPVSATEPSQAERNNDDDYESTGSVWSYEEPHLYTQLLSSRYIMVAAIDFGTSYSGYAFSFRHDYERDKLKISTNLWPHNNGLSSKAPSAVLIGPDMTVRSFGYEAQSKYNELVESGKAEDCRFFQRFKMTIYETQNLNNNTTIKDITGKEMLAIDLFGLVIGYLKNHLISKLKGQDTETVLEEDMVQWILTVPAIWTEKAKQFMRLAAEKGGIQNEHLKLALEPEAASLYCREIPHNIALYGQTPTLGSLENGTKYLVLDIGGGTVDVTAHEIQEDGTLREMYQASGGSWGGTNVDDQFKSLLVETFGSDVIREASVQYPNDILDLVLDFEMKKRLFKPGETEHLTIKCPASLFAIFEEKHSKTIIEHMQETCPNSGVTIKRDKLLLGAKTFEALFDDSVYKLLMHLRKLLELEELSGLNTLLLVGGFSDSEIIKSSIVSNFPDIRIIHPDDCSLAVLKGAVLYGHDHRAFKSRICKFSYGIGIHVMFKDGVHPEEKKKIINDDTICDDVFDIHLRVGERVEIGKPRLERFYYTKRTSEANYAYLDVYASTYENPQFVTDEASNYLGSLMIELTPSEPDEKSSDMKKVFVSFHYMGSELGVVVREENSEKTIKAKFDFIG